MPGKEEDSGVRRSGRHRKLQYSTLSESVIIDGKNIIISDSNRRLHRGAYGAIESDTSYPPACSTRRSTRNVRHILEEEDEPTTSGQTSARTSDRNVKLEETPDTDSETFDIYSRIKRRRSKSKNFYESPLSNPSPTPPRKSRRILIEEDEEEEIVDGDESNQSFPPTTRSRAKTTGVKTGSVAVVEEDESTGSEGDNPPPRQYFLREHRPVVQRYEVLPQPKYKGTKETNMQYSRPSRLKERVAYFSPARRHRSRPTRQSRSPSTSSDGEDNLLKSPDKKFERRSAKSLLRAKERFLPLNVKSSEARQAGVIRDRMRISGGASCSDIDPMAIDKTTNFKSIGGLEEHLRSLKEMILFPFIYPEVFSKFQVNPPRGVLFYGPPGTGKTLVARALANECSEGERKVAFFMRKGADCLSKWVGESERQLRLLFDQAYTMRPSIIFFDEIDGLAPVRSSRQDQIHSSIVSTLLALMDGLDQRGEVIIIGATNRLDAIDPALRRPGRFDRELRFSLPDRTARKQILAIHTKDWQPVPEVDTLDTLAIDTVNYCGADLKGLCTEAALLALRTTYPQIYASHERLQLDPSKVIVKKWHFQKAMSRMVPASKRNEELPTKQLIEPFDCLLEDVVQSIIDKHVPIGYLPQAIVPSSSTDDAANSYEKVISVFDQSVPLTRGRLLLCSSSAGDGASSHILPAILHKLDHLPIFYLPLSKVLGSAARSPEETVADVLNQAVNASASKTEKRGASVLYIPSIDEMCKCVPETVWKTLTSIISSWDALTPVLVFATSRVQYDHVPIEVRVIFNSHVFQLQYPRDYGLKGFFDKLLLDIACRPPEILPVAAMSVLPVAPSAPPRKLSETEKKALRKQEEVLLRELRIFLREMLGRLLRDRRFVPFLTEVDRSDAPDYYEIIAEPMDLSTVGQKLDTHEYETVGAFLKDIDLITANALEYNPKKSVYGSEIRRRACALRDTAYALIEQELDPEFEERIREIKESRIRRGDVQPAEPPPPFLLTAPPTRDITPTFNKDSKVDRTSGEEQRHSTRGHQVSKKSKVDKRRHSEPAEGAGNKITRRPRSISIWCRPRRKKVACKRSRMLARSIVNKYKAKRSVIGSNSSNGGSHSPKNIKAELEGNSNSSSPSIDLPVPEAQVLLVDKEKLSELVDFLVERHSKSSFDQVQLVYASLMGVVQKYEKIWDRRPMTQQLQAICPQID